MAKKRKGSRPSAAGRKKKATKKVRGTVYAKSRTGLESAKEVDFRPLKTQIRAHINRLSKVKDPSLAVTNALRTLEQASSDLTTECLPTMVLPTP